jgi:hypothetical protein
MLVECFTVLFYVTIMLFYVTIVLFSVTIVMFYVKNVSLDVTGGALQAVNNKRFTTEL